MCDDQLRLAGCSGRPTHAWPSSPSHPQPARLDISQLTLGATARGEADARLKARMGASLRMVWQLNVALAAQFTPPSSHPGN